jgi:hypothetical protein
MRIALTAICLAFGSSLALAQANAPANEAPAKAGDSPQSDGRTVSPETKGVQQPQGPTGPTETKSGGAPAESPQGQTPPGMQAAPGGSSKTVVDPEAAKKEPVAQSPGPSQPSATPQPSADTIFQNGVLTVTGANPDNQAAPAKFSKCTDAADQLPIAAYALKHLTPDQRSRIYQALHKSLGISANTSAIEPTVGAEISADIVFHGVQLLPRDLAHNLPELTGLAFMRDADKVLIFSPTMHRVLAVIEQQ